MPLHDWSDPAGWEGMHHLWITELLRWVKPRLPIGYRAYIGSAPLLAVGAPVERPDVGVRSWSIEARRGSAGPVPDETDTGPVEPDEEVAVATLNPETAVYVERQGRLIAAVEVISPRNKDRPIARSAYLTRYLGYLLDGAHLVLIDVHRRPPGFSFADRIAAELHLEQPSVPPPMAVSYRVGEPAATGGRLLAIWRRPLAVGAALPTIPLPLTVEQSVPLDLEQTYARAASDAYLS
ncbi:MAG: DUF4058 family protein [Planctomycetaceae bacterium]